MHRLVVILVVLVAACAAGYVVWLLTDSTSASYIVGVLGTALGAAALLVPESRQLRARIRSRLDIRSLRGTHVENVRAPAGQDVDAAANVGNAEGGVIRNVIVESADEPERRGTP